MANEETFRQDILVALSEFDEESKLISKEAVNELRSNWETPSVIYHYTNDLGLRGILETGKFWLTDIFKLNDPSELEHGISHLIEALKANSDSLGKNLSEHVEAFRSRRLTKSARYFVCAFSSDGNELGQWRAYADNGRGFSLGFDRNALEDTFMNDKTSEQENATFPVTYDDGYLFKKHEELVERLFLKIHWHSMKVLNRDDFVNKLLFPLILRSLYLTLHFKHEAYKNEQEYRFLQVFAADASPPEVKSRSRHYSLVEYREFDWRTVAAKALQKIWIGPAPDKPKASQFARDCLKEFNIDSVELMQSKIPYRAL